MTRFKRLTDAEARTLTRRELLDRVEAEQAYWFRGHRDRKDPEGYREFGRIMHAYLDPAAMIGELLDLLNGRGAPDYWETRPGEPS